MANRKQFRNAEPVRAGILRAQSPETPTRKARLLDRLLESSRVPLTQVEPDGAALYDFLIHTTGPAGEEAAFRPGTRGSDLTLTGTATLSGTAQIGTLWHQGAQAAFFGNIPTTKPTITGAKGGNVALANLLVALAGLGLLVDTTT